MDLGPLVGVPGPTALRGSDRLRCPSGSCSTALPLSYTGGLTVLLALTALVQLPELIPNVSLNPPGLTGRSDEFRGDPPGPPPPLSGTRRDTQHLCQLWRGEQRIGRHDPHRMSPQVSRGGA